MSEDKGTYEKLIKFIQDSNNKQTNEIKEHINNEIAVINNALKEEIDKRTQLEKKYEQLSEKYISLQKSLKKNNIIVFGLEVDKKNSLVESVLEKLNTHMNLNLTKQDINNIYTIGKEQTKKPIVIKFISFLRKVEVLRSSKNLKNTGITISEELSEQERATNKVLRQHMKEARSKNLNAYIRGRKLYVSGTPYTAEQLLTNNDQDTENVVEDKSKPRGAPPTPTPSSSKTATKLKEGHVEEAGDIKKRKAITAPNRSSPRFNIIETEAFDINEKKRGVV